jgi:hypothetical protein
VSPNLEVSVFADRPVGADRRVRTLDGPPGVAVHPLAALPAVEGLSGPFDAVVYVLADDEHHTGALATLRRRGLGGGRNVVVALDERLSDLYGYAAREGGLPEGLEQLIGSAYGDGVERGLGERNLLSAAEANRRGILLTRDAVAHSGRYLLTSAVDAALAQFDAAPEDRPKIAVVTGDPAGLAGALYSELTGL